MLLPFEILNKVASYTESQYECVRVNRRWLTGFQAYLYSDIHISTRRRWKQFLRTIQDNVHLGRLVKHLNIAYHVGLTRDEFEALNLYFPLLISLDFNPKLWKYQRHTDKKDWKRISKLPPLSLMALKLQLTQHYGNSLTGLVLFGGLVNQLHRHGQLLPLFQTTPHLKGLQMYGRDKLNATTLPEYTQTRFTYKDILDLHALLPGLESLELFDVLLVLQSEINQCMRFPGMRQFRVQGKFAHYAWVSLIAQLYPNLRDLEVKVSWEEAYKQTMTFQDREAAKTGLLHIANTCRQLQTVRLVSLDSVIKNAHQLFYQTLSKGRKVGLSSIDGIMVSSLMELKQLANAILQCCDAENTQTLRLQFWRDMGRIDNIMISISWCHGLKELELNCGKFFYSWNYGCDIDTIAENCPLLQTLTLSKTRLTVSKQQKVAFSNVETIHLNQVHFTTKSMDTLSVCFPNLKHFNMSSCVKDKDGTNHKIAINIQNQTLETFNINKLYLRPSQYVEKSTIDAAFFAIEFFDRSRREEKRVGQRENARWYHLNNKKGTRQLKRLNSCQSNQLQSYQMKDEDWNLLQEGSIRGTYRESKYWESDLPFGYVHVTCNLIHNLVLNKVLV